MLMPGDPGKPPNPEKRKKIKMKIKYADRKFSPVAQAVIDQAEAICDEYAAQGYNLTLRGLYYQFIRRDAFPESRRNAAGTKNHQQNYKWLGDLVSDARIGGLVDWSHIDDPTRSAEGGDAGWQSPGDAVASINDWYSIPKWDGQDHYLEVWVEKEALADVISRPCSRWNVRYMACKGSPSTSAMRKAAQRLRAQEREGKKTEVIYLGDHDPTGLDISRDVQDRLEMFWSGATVDRIALNMDQITPDLPPSPAKLTDSRAAGYIDLYGDDTWELDALEPAFLDGLVEDAILQRLDRSLWDARVRQEEHEKRQLQALSDNWLEILSHMVDQGMVDEDTGDEAD
jgi:hypothetical protein